MLIQEEKGPEKTPSPDLKVQTQEIPQNEKEAENVPDTTNPKASKT
jgi:hypothetical protein